MQELSLFLHIPKQHLRGSDILNLIFPVGSMKGKPARTAEFYFRLALEHSVKLGNIHINVCYDGKFRKETPVFFLTIINPKHVAWMDRYHSDLISYRARKKSFSKAKPVNLSVNGRGNSAGMPKDKIEPASLWCIPENLICPVVSHWLKIGSLISVRGIIVCCVSRVKYLIHSKF